MIVVAKFKDGQKQEFKNVKKIIEMNERCVELFDNDDKLISRMDNKHVSFVTPRNE